jgi:hypothetical protein
VNGRVPEGKEAAVERLRRSIDAADERISEEVHTVTDVDMNDAETARITKKMRELGYL